MEVGGGGGGWAHGYFYRVSCVVDDELGRSMGVISKWCFEKVLPARRGNRTERDASESL